ncbi:hypothetical protein KL942_004941 [Ogataea angusta]|uniref:Uncharacterized protein n=1 Tax=Pichia angusta TaxID=870730 RepID=A0ABQ7RQW2_PICAN|nr:hypothetical protein KL942_004941 [Ogataea angusta]KAG7845966.1 hypothetical protein KL940_004805 [Ogataea angusta]KAG7854949.1 hypothetical protein KL939_004698 [Ogataea angusta]
MDSFATSTAAFDSWLHRHYDYISDDIEIADLRNSHEGRAQAGKSRSAGDFEPMGGPDSVSGIRDDAGRGVSVELLLGSSA